VKPVLGRCMEPTGTESLEAAPEVVLDVVIASNVAIAICANEEGTYAPAVSAVTEYARGGCRFFAPGVLFSEALYTFCGKEASRVLPPAEYDQAVRDLIRLGRNLQPPPEGDSALVERAEAIRGQYGCSHSADSIYIALAESLGPSSVLLTFDKGMKRQAATNAPLVNVHLFDVEVAAEE
jgi:predicted nucleic acid-binding protein